MSDKDQVKIFFVNSITAMFENLLSKKNTLIEYKKWKTNICQILDELDFTAREVQYIFEQGEDRAKHNKQVRVS
jgi:hypothetical protein